MKIENPLLIAVWVCLLTVVLPGTGYTQQTFFDGFEDGIDPDLWSFWAIQPEFVVDDSQGYVEFSNPYGGDGWGYFEDIGICFNGRLHGAFNVSVEFSELLLEDPGYGADGANEANLSVFFGGQDISVERRNYSYEGQTIVSWVGPPDEWQGSQPSDASSGIMRIVRNGSEVTTSVNDQPVITGTFNEAPVTGMCLRLANWGGLGKVSVRFDNFSVTADSIDFPLAAWRRHLATTTQNDGGDSALAFDPSGSEVAIAFTDWDSGELKVVRGAEDGPVWLWGTPEVVAPGGQDIDLSYDPCGDLWLSYLELSPKDGTIKLARWSATDGTWTLHQLDFGSTVGRGTTTSLALPQGQCGPPSVAYGLSPKNLYEITFVEVGEPPVLVEGGRESKGYTSLAYAPNGEPAIAYRVVDQDDCRSIRLNTRSSGVWTPETVVAHDGGGINGVGLTFQNGLPVVVYSGPSQALFFCEQQGSWQCSSLNDRGMSRPSIVVNDANDVVTVGAAKWDSLWVYSRPLQGTYWYVERFGMAAPGDAAVDPTGNAAFSFWLGPELYLGFRHPGTCSGNNHCDDANPCSTDTCSDAGVCEYAFHPDGAVCGTTDEVCCSGQCVARYALDGVCDDGNECTTDQYQPGGSPPCSSYCEHELLSGCEEECVPTSSKEKGPRCSDGLDNDCDGVIDGDDPDC